jgi:hypothetical protein
MKRSHVVGLVTITLVVIVGLVLIKTAERRGENGVSPKPIAADDGDKVDTQDDSTGQQRPDVTVPDDLTGQQRPAVTVPDDPNQVSEHQKKLDQNLTGLEMSAAVRAVMGLDVDKDNRDARRAGLQKLTRTLSADDAKALMLFLEFRHDDNSELKGSTFAGIKNDVLVVLFNQKQVPENLGTRLTEMFVDEKHTVRWRDYSLQYMSQYYDEVSKPDDPQRKQIVETYDVALSARKDKYAGTAIMAVERLSRKHPDFDRQKIGDTAVEIALADDTCYDSRISSLRVCALMNRAEVLPQARILAQTGATMPVRLAAIATVGDLGDKSDLEYIESLALSDDRRLQRISKSASANLKKRLSAESTPATGT